MRWDDLPCFDWIVLHQHRSRERERERGRVSQNLVFAVSIGGILWCRRGNSKSAEGGRKREHFFIISRAPSPSTFEIQADIALSDQSVALLKKCLSRFATSLPCLSRRVRWSFDTLFVCLGFIKTLSSLQLLPDLPMIYVLPFGRLMFLQISILDYWNELLPCSCMVGMIRWCEIWDGFNLS